MAEQLSAELRHAEPKMSIAKATATGINSASIGGQSRMNADSSDRSSVFLIWFGKPEMLASSPRFARKCFLNGALTQGRPADGPTLGFITKPRWGFRNGHKKRSKPSFE
jgi:hypothetical protein